MNRVRAFLFFILLTSLCGFTAEASRSCESLFAKSEIVLKSIEQIDQKNNLFLFQGKSVSEHSLIYSRWRQRKIRKLLQDIELQKIPSQQAVERYAIELGEALFGSRKSLSRWIFKNKSERLEESTVLMIKEKLLTEGLIKTWGSSHDPTSISNFKRALSSIDNFLNSNAGQLLRLPFALPSIQNKALPNEFVLKVIRDGFSSHASEAQALLKTRTRVEAYNTFRHLYSANFFRMVLVVASFNAYHNFEITTEHQVQETIIQLEQGRNILAQKIPEAKKEIFNQAYNSMVEEFIKKYNEPPTEAEKVLIKEKIHKALAI
jgi:hypothetical protein